MMKKITIILLHVYFALVVFFFIEIRESLVFTKRMLNIKLYQFSKVFLLKNLIIVFSFLKMLKVQTI